MDIDDLWADVADRARSTGVQARDELHRRTRFTGVRRRARTATMWASGAWVVTFGGLGVASEVAIDGGPGTIFAVLFGAIAVPAVPTGIWAFRGRRRYADVERAEAARRAARKERDGLPREVASDWVRLRRAQSLVVELAGRGLVDEAAVHDQAAMVDELHGLLVADRRAVELGATPTEALRRQVTDTADLLVALAAEAVELRAEQVDASEAPATLRDAHERLTTLRSARAEVSSVELGGDVKAANDLIDQARATGRSAAAPSGEPVDGEVVRRPHPRPDVDGRGDAGAGSRQSLDG